MKFGVVELNPVFWFQILNVIVLIGIGVFIVWFIRRHFKHKADFIRRLTDIEAKVTILLEKESIE